MPNIRFGIFLAENIDAAGKIVVFDKELRVFARVDSNLVAAAIVVAIIFIYPLKSIIIPTPGA